MALASGATIDGRKPVPGMTVTQGASNGGASPSTPKQSQVAAEGATDPGTGRRMEPTPSTPALAGSPEVQTTNTTAEERRKKSLGAMYPSAKAT